ncbi:MAG TPA: glycine/sarcosine/betaine reductase selenoprotein B family protein [Vicinamibacteria bacterium]|nr:glycine/sarcosine/betaine reductase selenoprotein B family protein [Vicinamibacteria bacterium]
MDDLKAIRKHIRAHWVPEFEWAEYDSPALPHPVRKPLGQCRVGLVSSAGVYLRDSQAPFEEGGGRGDHSFRVLPFPLDPTKVAIAHEHYSHEHAEADLNCVLPVDALTELAGEGKIGSVSSRIYSLMGYVPVWRPLLTETAPAIARLVAEDRPDVVLYAPV